MRTLVQLNDLPIGALWSHTKEPGHGTVWRRISKDRAEYVFSFDGASYFQKGDTGTITPTNIFLLGAESLPDGEEEIIP